MFLIIEQAHKLDPLCTTKRVLLEVFSINDDGDTELFNFLELGYLRPDIILKDLVKIGHPELLKEHQLYFHVRLE